MFSIWTASACWPSTKFLLSLVSAYRDIQYISIKVPDDQLGVRECDDHSGVGADDDHIDDVVVNEVPQPVAAQTFYINFTSSWCERFIQLYSVEWQLFCAKQIFTKKYIGSMMIVIDKRGSEWNIWVLIHRWQSKKLIYELCPKGLCIDNWHCPQDKGKNFNCSTNDRVGELEEAWG